MNINNEEQLLRVEDVSKILKISQRTIYRWLKSGKISGKKIGRAWYINPNIATELTEDIATKEGERILTPLLNAGEHLIVLASERTAVIGMMAKLIEIGLKHDFNLFAGCWPFKPDELRALLRTLDLPTSSLESEGTLNILDFNKIFKKSGSDGILDKWYELVEISKNNKPLLAIGAPSLDCWESNLDGLIKFEHSLNKAWQESCSVSVCIYPLLDFVPNNLRRLGTLIENHTGVLIGSDSELVLLRPDNFSSILTKI